MGNTNKKISVLHLIETGGPGGAENVLIDLANCLNKKKFTSIVLLCKKGWLYEQLVKRDIETYVFEEEGFFDLSFIVRLILLVIKKKVSIIHAHEFLMCFYAAVVGMVTFRPVVATIHGKYYYWEKMRRRVIMRFISRIGQIVSVSKELKLYIEEKVQIPQGRVKVIYNGIDLDKYSRLDNITANRLKLDIGENKKIVCTIGNLYPVKGHKYLLNAIPSVVKLYPNVVFLLAGRGEEEQRLREEVAELKITKYVMFLGFRSDVPELLSLADIFVLPSLAESLPLSLLEAMAMKLPSVVTDVGGNREIIDDQETGYIVPPANSEAIASRIIYLLGEEEVARKIGELSRESIRRKFSIERMLSNYEAIYSSFFAK